jgi:hypothetical protein
MKIVDLNIDKLYLIVEQVLSESKQYLSIPKPGCETFIKGQCDPYSYLKEVEPDGKIRFFYKLSGDTSWKESITQPSWGAIKNNVTFDQNENPNPETLPTRYVPRKKQNTNASQSTPSQLDDIIKNWKSIALGKYKMQEDYKKLKNIINNHKFKYNFNIKDKTVYKNCFNGDKYICCSDALLKKEDKNVNVFNKINKIYNWRNKKIAEFERSSSYSNQQKKDAYNNLLVFSTMINDKLESDFQKRWQGEVSHEIFADKSGYC